MKLLDSHRPVVERWWKLALKDTKTAGVYQDLWLIYSVAKDMSQLKEYLNLMPTMYPSKHPLYEKELSNIVTIG